MRRATLSLAILAAAATISTTTTAYPQVRCAPYGSRAANSPDFGNRYQYFGLGYGYGPGGYNYSGGFGGNPFMSSGPVFGYGPGGYPPSFGYGYGLGGFPFGGYGYGYAPGAFGQFGGPGYGGYGYGGYGGPAYPGAGNGSKDDDDVYVGYNAPPYQYPGTRNGYRRRQSNPPGYDFPNRYPDPGYASGPVQSGSPDHNAGGEN